MSLRSQVHLLVDAITLPIHISRETPGHLVVVTFIRQNKRTDVEIEFHQIEGGVKATSFFCLLGIGIGLTSYLVYKLHARVLPTCRSCLTTLVSRLKQKQPEHVHRDSAVDFAFLPLEAVQCEQQQPKKAYSTCGERCHTERPFSCDASHAGSELILRSGRLHPSCPRTMTDVTEWLLGNGSPYHTDKAPLGKIQKEMMRWKSLESSKSRDLGFVSSNLISTTSGFCTQSLDHELDNHVATGFGNFRSRLNNETCFAAPDDDETLSYLDASNNNVSSEAQSNRLSFVTESQSVLASNASLDREGHPFGQVHPPLNYTSFEGIHSRFHSTPDYAGNDHAGHKRKGSSNAIGHGSFGSGGSVTSDQSRRESVVSNAFSNDLRTSLSDMDSSVSEVFEGETSSIGKATLSDMDQLQSQLQLINDDIGNMNEQMEVLQLREDPKTVVARRYTLGTTEAVSRLHCRPQRRRRLRVTNNVFSNSCGFPFRIDEESSVAVASKNKTDPDVDFLWDYQSEIDGNARKNEDDMLVIQAPLDDTNSYDSYSVPPSSNSCHSLNSDASFGDYENLHWVEERSLADDSKDENQVQANTTDMYIDDDLTGLEDDEFQFAAQRYKEPLAQLSDLPPLTIKGHKHLFSNLLDFQQTGPDPSAAANAEATHVNEAPSLRTCANCGSNVNVINNNVNINMNLQVPNMETAFHASINPANVPGIKTWCPNFAFSADPSGCSKAKVDGVNRLSQWEVENVGAKCSFFQYINSEVFRHKCKSQQSTKEGYLEVRKLFGPTYIRTIRSDNYCALRTVLYQVLVNNVAITKTIGSSQETITRLTVFTNPRYGYLHSWNFANRLPYVRGMVVETLMDCINCLHLQIEVLSQMKTVAEREQYLTSLLNHSPEIDLKLLEAVKALMMIKAIELYDQFCVSRFSVPTFVWLMFSRYMTIDPEMLLHNWINPLGDSTCLQKCEMHLLGMTLGVKIEVIRPYHFEEEDFIAHYPDEGADSFEKVTIVEEDDNRYSILMA